MILPTVPTLVRDSSGLVFTLHAQEDGPRIYLTLSVGDRTYNLPFPRRVVESMLARLQVAET